MLLFKDHFIDDILKGIQINHPNLKLPPKVNKFDCLTYFFMINVRV